MNPNVMKGSFIVMKCLYLSRDFLKNTINAIIFIIYTKRGVIMNFIKNLMLVVLLLMLTACVNDNILTYKIEINEEIPTIYEVGDSIDFKSFFIIKDQDGNTIEIIDSMINHTLVDLEHPGVYTFYINYLDLEESMTIEILNPVEVITYIISINLEVSNEIEINDDTIDYRDFFIIKDSNGQDIEVLISMLDLSLIDITKVGTYPLTISFNGTSEQISIHVVDKTPVLSYEITVNEELSKEITLGSSDIDFKSYFIITDSLGQTIEITDSMIDFSNVELNQVGTFLLTISYMDLTKTIQFEVIAPQQMYASDLFISEYSEGSNYNKYIEIFNGTGRDIDLSSYSVQLFNYASIPAQYTFNLSGILKDGDTYIIYNRDASALIKEKGDVSHQVISFNGNDPIALFKDDMIIDIVGDLNQQVQEGYAVGDVAFATKDHTLIRKSNVFGPNPTWMSTEWEVLGFEDYSNLKSHEMDYYHKDEPETPSERIRDLYISEYFEGNGTYKDSKYIEIYNGLGYDVDLSSYAIHLFSDGSMDPSFIQPLSGILKSNEVYIVYAPYSLPEITQVGHLSSQVAFFNGRQAIALVKADQIIDLIGVIGEYPDNTGWFVDEITGTANNTLIRHYDVTAPTASWIREEWYVCYENYLYDIGQHQPVTENLIIEDFDILFNLIKVLELDSKGTATSQVEVTIKGTLYMDVKNETTLVYLTDGKKFIRLHGNKIHNYTQPNTVYEVTGYYKAFLYQPTFEVNNPDTDIKSLKTETPISTIIYKEVLLSDILNLKKENFVFNIEQGYLQSMLRIKGYLQLDQHNSTRWDYALTTNETYAKNDTQYIQNGLYFKNDVGELEDFLIDYEVEPGLDNREVYVFGIIYDWNPNRKNWRIYISEALTFYYLTTQTEL